MPPRAKKTAEPEIPPPAQPEDDNRSEEVQVVPPAADEPVRRGGHILTDDGWVAETQPVPGDEQQAEDDPAQPEQEN